jgi:ABC-2 type transport system permease protein
MLIPVAFITTVPAEMAIGRVDYLWVAGAVLSTVLLFLFSRWFFIRNLGFYSSASS